MTHARAPDTAAVVLAGGRSSRFGADKAGALWRGRPLVDHVVARLSTICDEVVVVARPDQDRRGWGPHRLVEDDASLPEGPLRGIAAGLHAIASPGAFVVTCDAPLVHPALLLALRRRPAPDDLVVVAEWEGVLQPLTAWYDRRCLQLTYTLLEHGLRSPLDLLAAVPCAVLDGAACRAADPDGLSFVNINTPADLASLPVGAALLEEHDLVLRKPSPR